MLGCGGLSRESGQLILAIGLTARLTWLEIFHPESAIHNPCPHRHSVSGRELGELPALFGAHSNENSRATWYVSHGRDPRAEIYRYRSDTPGCHLFQSSAEFERGSLRTRGGDRWILPLSRLRRWPLSSAHLPCGRLNGKQTPRSGGPDRRGTPSARTGGCGGCRDDRQRCPDGT